MTISEIIDENNKPSTSSLQSSSSSSSLNNNDKTIQELSDRKNEELQIESVSPEIPKDIQKYIAGKLIPIINNFDNSVEGPSSNIIVNENNFENVGGPITIGDVIHLHLDAAETDLIALNSKNNNQYRESSNKTKLPSPQFPQTLIKRIKRVYLENPILFWSIGSFSIMMIVALITLFVIFLPFGDSSSIAGHGDDLGDGIQIIKRNEWLARPPLSEIKIDHPLKMVRILHTGGSFCDNYQSCANKMLALQGWMVGTKGMPDISYNYCIGGDGNVYVGRGAGIENQYYKTAIDICYIGNYLTVYDKVSEKMDKAGRRIIAKLRRERYLTEDYVVVPHNQTYNTQSPGDNIYAKMIHWPHYDSGLYY